MKKIFSVTKIELALNKSNPPSLVVTAFGTTNTDGWTDFILRPLWNRTNPPSNDIYEFSFEGTPPAGPATQMITDVGPASYTLSFNETLDAKRIVIYAASNHQSIDRKTDIDPGFAPDKILQNAIGYSDKWNLEEAFRDAIKNLPHDDNAYPDKLYHFTIISIGAEIGGIAGFNRMVVKING